ncbi:hypothetical protein [Streptomyces sp. NPDC002490]|uniref:hypothetical protein n=1 Tax=Streptomyces sp. NPDC002490 TaxID=3154416 RepID=UPI00332DD565
MLGADSAADLLGRHPFLSPYGRLSALIADATFKVDDLDQRVQERTAHISQELDSVRGGQSAIALGSASTEIALLSARRDQSAEHLQTMAGACRRSPANGAGHAPAQRLAQVPRTSGGPASPPPRHRPLSAVPADPGGPTVPTLRTALPGRTESIDQALASLAPRWTTWLLQTLCQQEVMRSAEIVAATPWNSHSYTVQLLTRMQDRDLVHRLKFGTYEITESGRGAEPVHRALAAWHRAHFSTATADAERAEDVLARLRGAGTTAALTVLDRYGPLTATEVSRETGLQSSSVFVRLTRMQQDGLLMRHTTATRRGGEFELTPAAQQLGDVYAALASWPLGAEPPTTTARSVVIRAQAASSEWAAVAVQRSPSLPTAPATLFSHPPGAQPQVPASVTALSRPPRSR